MPTALTIDAVEESTYVITASFTDEDDIAVVPNAGLMWSLTDSKGAVINSRSDVAITPASTIEIVLKGDDLAIGEHQRTRTLTIEGDYDSSLGAGLPLKDSATFDVVGLTAVP